MPASATATPNDLARLSPPVVEKATQYTYLHHAMSPDDERSTTLTVTVEWRGGDRWVILRSGRRCMHWNGSWDFDSRDRSDVWLDRHRFTLDVARKAAAKAAERLYEEWMANRAAREQQRDAAPEEA